MFLIKRENINIFYTEFYLQFHKCKCKEEGIKILCYIFYVFYRSALRTVTFSDINKSLEEKEELTSVSTSTVTSTTEYYSAISSDDEFFDLPRYSNRNLVPHVFLPDWKENI